MISYEMAAAIILTALAIVGAYNGFLWLTDHRPRTLMDEWEEAHGDVPNFSREAPRAIRAQEASHGSR